MASASAPGFTQIATPDPHRARARRLLASHPELSDYIGSVPWTSLFVLGLVALQTALAVALAHAPWWQILIAAMTVGAVASLGLWVLIHECAHNLVFGSTRANCWLAIVANMPHIFPTAAAFRKYHLLHHRFHGHRMLDPDVPSALEVRLVGNSPWRKALWLLVFPIGLSLRSTRIRQVALFDRWFVANSAIVAGYLLTLWVFAAPKALVFLALSTMLSLGLHPLGARSIQEHFTTTTGQETTSYYGPFNILVFNAGYHIEHHDLMRVSWLHLPKLKAIAPEFYGDFRSHGSWTALLVRFIFDRGFTLADRITRLSSDERKPRAATAAASGQAAQIQCDATDEH